MEGKEKKETIGGREGKGRGREASPLPSV